MMTRITLLPAIALLAVLPACSDGPGASEGTPGAGAGGAAGSGGALQAAGGSSGLAGSGASTSGGAGAAGSSGAGGSSGSSAGTSGSGGAGGMGGAGGSAPMGPVTHHVMAIEYPGRLVEISAEGQKLWEHQTPSLTVMFNVLPNGNVFYPHGGASRGAQEVDRNHSVVWNYDSAAGELLGGERLANGNSVLGEGGPPKAIELTPTKQLAGSVDVATNEMAAHGQIRHVHRLSNGNVLLALESDGVAREIDPTGKTVWEFTGVAKVHEAVRLPNGNTLIGGGQSKRVIEVMPNGQIAWEFNEQDGPGLGLAWITSIQVLKNGDLLVGNWVGGEGGPGVHAFQVTRDKKVVWKLDDHQLLKSATTVTALDD